jgi:hypothetical protein
MWFSGRLIASLQTEGDPIQVPLPNKQISSFEALRTAFKIKNKHPQRSKVISFFY